MLVAFLKSCNSLCPQEIRREITLGQFTLLKLSEKSNKQMRVRPEIIPPHLISLPGIEITPLI